MHFDYIAVGGGSVDDVPPRVRIQMDETEDEGVHEERDALGGARG